MEKGNFTLKKFKANVDGVAISYKVVKENSIVTRVETIDLTPHADLLAVLNGEDAFKGVVIRMLNLHPETELSVNEVSISKKGVVLSGTFTTIELQNVKFKTPKIRFEEDKYVEGESLRALVSRLQDEAYLFLFENKIQEDELFGQEAAE